MAVSRGPFVSDSTEQRADIEFSGTFFFFFHKHF